MLKKLFKRDELERLDKIVGGVDTTGDSEEAKSASQETVERVEKVVTKSKRGGDIARKLSSADFKLRVVEFMGLKLVAAVIGIGVGMFIGRGWGTSMMFLTGFVGFVAFSFVPDVYVSIRAGGRVKAFSGQLGDTITMMANALRGGYSFLQTMQMVSEEAPEPTATEFKRVVQEVGLGRTTNEALTNMLKRVPSDDLDLLITAVGIQNEVGGNLATILDSIGHTIRERVRIKGQIKTLTAQGRLSGYVITGLPIAMGGYISMVNPTYMAPLWTFGMPPDAWCCLPVTSLFFIAVGYVVMMKIVDIEV